MSLVWGGNWALMYNIYMRPSKCRFLGTAVTGSERDPSPAAFRGAVQGGWCWPVPSDSPPKPHSIAQPSREGPCGEVSTLLRPCGTRGVRWPGAAPLTPAVFLPLQCFLRNCFFSSLKSCLSNQGLLACVRPGSVGSVGSIHVLSSFVWWPAWF